MNKLSRTPVRAAAVCVSIVLGCALAESQSPAVDLTQSPAALLGISVAPAEPASVDMVAGFPSDHPQSSAAQENDAKRHGFIVRNLRRGLEDQKGLYLAPLKPKNLKWDALVLGVTGGFLAGDRQISRQISNDNVNISHHIALVALLGTGGAAGSVWLHGIKTDNPHAKETGEITLEALANTFLIYTPMQFIAGRERPDEGTGNGRFWRHGGFNTSFPAGHPMFTWVMASVLAHEYPRPWVKILAYGAALTVSGARLTGRNHFASDIWVGSALGYLIGAHIFHAHCDPALSESRHRER